MQFISKLLFLFLLLIVAHQDFKSREISWWLVPLLILSILLFEMEMFHEKQKLIDISLNSSLVLLSLFTTTIYFSVKKRKLVNIIDSYIGLGDVFLLLVCALVFSFPNFLLFLISSFLLSIIISLIIIFFRKEADKEFTTPLAGLMSSYLFILTLLDLRMNNDLFRNSFWLENSFIG